MGQRGEGLLRREGKRKRCESVKVRRWEGVKVGGRFLGLDLVFFAKELGNAGLFF